MRHLSAIVAMLVAAPLAAQSIDLPPRPANAPGATAILAEIGELPLKEREARIIAEVTRGNVPSWNRRWVPVEVRRRLGSSTVKVIFWVLPDYLAIGSDEDWFLAPLSPQAATRLGDLIGTSLPTPLMVDAIWKNATARIDPDSITPSPAMVTVPVFIEHQGMVQARRTAAGITTGTFVAGHKKDVVLTPRLDSLPGRVAIYGWHRPDSIPIQPLYTGHNNDHVDYSHGIRLVRNIVSLDGMEHELTAVLRDPMLAQLLSVEGPLREGRYPWQ